MCSKIFNREKKSEKSWWERFLPSTVQKEKIPEQEPDLKQEEVLYGYAYYLASYFNDNSRYEKEVRKALGITDDEEISIKKVINRFIEVIGMIKDNLEKEFKPDAYIEGGTKKYIMKEYAKWMKIMDDFLEKEEKRIKDTWVDIKNSQIENKKLREECDRVVEENKRRGEKCDRAVEENRKMSKEMRSFMQEMSSYVRHEETAYNGTNDQGASTSQQQPYSQGANDQQHESGAQASCAQSSRQKEPNAQSANDSSVPRSRSSSPGGSNNDQPGPSSKLDEVPPISRSQSLNSLHSSDSDVEIISQSQCR